jgi:16S rRNA (cytosine967-C5)-methyltransferase
MASIARVIAFKALSKLEKTQSDPQTIIADLTRGKIKPEDAAFARELFFGVIKYQRKIDYYARHFYQSEKLNRKLQQVVRLAFYQLIQTPNIPHYAAVSESVELATKYCSAKQAGFVNAIMRNYLRNPNAIALPAKNDNSIDYLGVNYSMPEWLVDRYVKRFGPAEAEVLLQWSNQPPDLYFFINNYITDSTQVESRLDELAICFEKFDIFDGYYKCLDPHKLIHSQLFADGQVVIGDPAQSLPVKALEVQPGCRALDLFAAPGGKSAALAGNVGSEGLVISTDLSLNRLQVMRQNFNRWRITNASIFCSDILKFASKRKFRYILADVPCSGTGSIRRNPDLRWKLQPDDIQRQASRQAKLIRAAAAILESQGRMVYSTCSIEPEENYQIIEGFLKQNAEYRLIDVDGCQPFRADTGLYEILPHKIGVDGAFAAVIEKVR